MHTIENLADVILKHLPTASERAAVLRGQSRAQFYATSLVGMIEHRGMFFGVNESEKKPDEIARSIRQLRDALNGMSEPDKRRLTALSFVNQVENYHRLGELITELETFLVGAEKLRRSDVGEKADKRRHWRAAAAARACRWVWATEEISSNGKKWQKYLQENHNGENDLQFLAAAFQNDSASAPHYEKQYTPGPFGRFLEDIMDAYGIRSQDGAESVSAKSALNSLASLRHS